MSKHKIESLNFTAEGYKDETEVSLFYYLKKFSDVIDLRHNIIILNLYYRRHPLIVCDSITQNIFSHFINLYLLLTIWGFIESHDSEELVCRE